MRARSEVSFHKPQGANRGRKESVTASTRIQRHQTLLHSGGHGIEPGGSYGEKLYNDLMREIIHETRLHGKLTAQEKVKVRNECS